VLHVEACEPHPPSCSLAALTPEVAAGGVAAFVLTLRDRYSNDLSSKNVYVPKLKVTLRVTGCGQG